ncbi:MAG: sensor domain-containing diguanylate cyclase [Candidatus Wallbacteria bacterium]|nr:sensor domain-containing diguanylate cyclase [Candidatus Wallbacteria bacterium]
MKDTRINLNQDLYNLTGLSESSEEKLRMINERLNLLFRIGQKIGDFSDMHELFHSLLDSVSEVIGAEYGSIMLWNAPSSSLQIVAARGLSDSIISRTRIHEGEGIAGFVFEKKAPLWVPNIKADPYFQNFLKQHREGLSLSFLSAPIMFKDEPLGVLNLSNKQNGDFNREDLNLLTLLASQLAIVVKNSRILEEARKSASENKVLFRLSERLNSSLNFKNNISKFFKLLARNLNLAEIGIALYHHEKRSYKFQFGHMMKAQEFQRYLKNILLSESQNYYFIIEDGDNVKKCLYFQPLQYENEILGLFAFTKNYSDDFNSFYDFSFVKALANQLSVSLKKEELIRKINSDTHYLNQVNQFIKNLSLHSFDINAINRDAVTVLNRLFKPDAIAIYLAHENRSLTLSCSENNVGCVQEILKRDYLKPPQLDSLAVDFVPPLVQSAGNKNNFAFQAATPLLSKNQKLGLIFIAGNRERFFSEKNQRQFFLICHHFAVAYENYCLFRMNERLAFTDPITELYNYRFFINSLKKEFSRARRYNLTLSLMILDIDYFKNFNDNYGHQQGDLILKNLGEILNSRIRNNLDTAARYGGEEFVIIVPDTGRTGAVELGERIRHAIESHAFADLKKKKQSHHVTVSLGATTFRNNNFTDIEEMISWADKALYQAKGNGRNQVVHLERTHEGGTFDDEAPNPGH